MPRCDCPSPAAVVVALLAATFCGAGAPAQTRLVARPAALDAAAIDQLYGVPIATWRFHAGDDARWASAEIDDAGWIVVPPQFFRRSQPWPEGWRGIAWLRAELDVAPELVGLPLALRVNSYGAQEIFIDGKRVARIGRPDASAEASRPRFQLTPDTVVFERPGRHLLAVRFANHHVARYLRGRSSTGLDVWFVSARSGSLAASRFATFYNRSFGWFTGVFLSFALLHLLLFVFYPAMRANLDFALLCLFAAAMVFLMTYRYVQDDPRFFLLFEPVMNVLGIGFGAAALRFIYGIFYQLTPRFLWLYLVVAAPVAVWSLFDSLAAVRVVFLMMLAASVELGRVVVVALVRRKPGARLVGVGALALAAGFAVGLLANLRLVPGNLWTTFLLPFLGVVALLAMMSVYLSRTFAAVHKALQARLEEVRRLGAEKLEQERRLRREEVERRVLEANYQQKVRELEEARQLQLSMLPRDVPKLGGLEIAAFMETATEVGGDYYDFLLAEDGALLVAIGDATGHGMRAGTMVTAAKSLFNALAEGRALVETLGRSTSVLKSMNLRKLTMALTLARYQDGQLTLAAAGMPPAMIYRTQTGALEQVLLGGMPLGALRRFPYQQVTVSLSPGDVVLLMSDGFPERLDPADEMLGYERAGSAFETAAASAASTAAIVERLRRDSEDWAAGRPPDDDVTFVVLKVTDGAQTGNAMS